MELSCFWRALYKANEDIVEGWQNLVERTDIQVLVDEILYHVIVAEILIDPDAQLVLVDLLYVKQMDGGMLGKELLVKANFKNVFLEVLLDFSNRAI